jgi:acyl-CoA dehydrogenase
VLAGQVRAQFAKLVRLVGARAGDDPDIGARLAEIGTDLDAMEMIDISVLSALQAGSNPGPVSSLLKLRWSQLRQSISELAVDAVGLDGLRLVPDRPLYETLQLPPDEEDTLSTTPRYLNYRAYTILGGTTEIQTGILARAMLGL